MVAERRDTAARGRAQARLEHAAEHHPEPERPRRVRHPDRLADPARLRELDVDAVRDLRAGRDIGERVAVLVDVDRDRRARLELAPGLVAGRQRLLAVLDPELGELRDRVERLLQRPPLVDVDLQRELGHAAHRAHALDVETVASSELQLEAPERGRGLLRASRHVVGVAEPDRPRGRRTGARKPEQAERRDSEELPLEVVERGVERRLRRLLARDRSQPRADLLERERVVAEQPGVLFHERERRLGGLVVALDRRTLAAAGHALVAQRHLHDVRVVGRLARDDERLGQLQPDDARLDLHAGRLRRRDRDDVRDHVRLVLAGHEAGRHDAGALPRSSRRPSRRRGRAPTSRGPVPPAPPSPWQPAHSSANTSAPRLGLPSSAVSDVSGSKICACASAKVATAIAAPTSTGRQRRFIRRRIPRS